MKNQMTVLFSAIFIFLHMVAQANSEELPAPEGDSFWKYISRISPYTQWSHWSDHEGLQKGRAPHGKRHRVFVNEKALASSKPPLQYGSIQVKESYDKAGEVKVITVMYKAKDYNPDHGDWFWARYSPSGETLKAGKLMGCIGCHATRGTNDYVLVHKFE